ncbi:MAG: prepilin-type N-terminal cleavage/methylation domain-containing protein [Betaproteobacteria bacterium]|nr:prepilin-type N-terminal cleavage/methylation domain-containing protein [Betaproteobacteria bacterium]
MRGFTLLEVMIVALLVSLMGMMSWRILESMIRSQDILKTRGEALEETQLFFNQWQRDCQALLPADRWRDGVPVVVGTDRMAWMIQAGDGIHRIGYALSGGVLRRIDQGPFQSRGDWQSDWQSVVSGGELTGKVDTLNVPGSRGLSGRFWLGNSWVTASSAQGIPVRALEILVVLADTGAPLRQVCLTGQD